MAKNLLIVESPAKAKTIEKYLGEDFKVASSYGHIRDLKKGNDAIAVDDNYKSEYVVPDDKKKVVSELKKLAKQVEEVWLATDEDREGEAISWHLCEVLGLKPEQTKRIVFNEITKTAIQRAVQNPRTLNTDLVDAQKARRVLDRLVGYELSPILWRKVRGARSAGRVQSVAVRLIVEREREVEAFKAKSSYKVSALFKIEKDGKTYNLKATLSKGFDSKEDARSFLEDCSKSNFLVKGIEVKPAKKSPSPPFTTSTLQQEASRKLGYSVAQTMVLAQKLYESGKITYMRTDSVNLSEEAKKGMAEQIEKDFGANYVEIRNFKSKSAGAQEAHEAIRPTNFGVKNVEGEANQRKLYDLIWKRAMASQMADAKLERTSVQISISEREEILRAKGEVIKFDGFLKLYLEGTDEEQEDEDSGLLPPLKEGQPLDLDYISALQRFSRPPSRFTEASLVKKLEELGIGRPSTYAPTISTIIKRQYVVKEDREGMVRHYDELVLNKGKIFDKEHQEITGSERMKLFPNDLGRVTSDFLLQICEIIMDYRFTAKMESKFDDVAAGQAVWTKVVDDFYREFKGLIGEPDDSPEIRPADRELGVDEKSGFTVIVRLGRYGPLAQIGKQDETDKPRFAPLRHGQSIETISFEQAMDLFKLPRILGDFEEKEVKVSLGRFGPYVLHDNKFTSIPKDEHDVYTIELEAAIELVKAKRKADAEKFIKGFETEDGLEIQILKGRWGPYIKKKGDRRNYTIPKELKEQAADLELEAVLELIKNAPPPGRRRKKK